MAITSDELDAFHHFALLQLASDGADSLWELVERWESEHSPAERHRQDAAAIRAAIRDMDSGDAGRPAAEIVRELRTELAELCGE
jgi:hypothetical protein